MKIVFENKNEDWVIKSKLSLKILNNERVKVHIDILDEEMKDAESAYFLEKEELSEFIGALLHIQSKLKNKR